MDLRLWKLKASDLIMLRSFLVSLSCHCLDMPYGLLFFSLSHSFFLLVCCCFSKPSQKLIALTTFLHLFQNARHKLMCCTIVSTSLYGLVLVLLGVICAITTLLCLSYHIKILFSLVCQVSPFMSCVLLFFSQLNTWSPVISFIFLIVANWFIISIIMSFPMIPFMNYSFSLLFLSLYSHSFTLTLRCPLHSSTHSFSTLIS